MLRAPEHDPWGRNLAGELHVLDFQGEVLRKNPLGDPSSRPLYAYAPPGWPDDGPYPTVRSIQGMTYRGSQFLDSPGTGRYMSYLCDELVPFIDGRASTRSPSASRAPSRASHRAATGRGCWGCCGPIPESDFPAVNVVAMAACYVAWLAERLER